MDMGNYIHVIDYGERHLMLDASSYPPEVLLIQHLADIGVPFHAVTTFLDAISTEVLPVSGDTETASVILERASMYLLSDRYQAISIHRIVQDRSGLTSSFEILKFVRGVLTHYALYKNTCDESIIASALLKTIRECGPDHSCLLARLEISRTLQLLLQIPCLQPVKGGVSGLSLYSQLEILFDFVNRVCSDCQESDLSEDDKMSILRNYENEHIDQTCRQIVNRYLTADAQVPFFSQWLEFIESLSAVASHHICGQEDASLLCSFLISKSSVMESSSFPAEYLKYSTIALAVLESVTHFYSDPE